MGKFKKYKLVMPAVLYDALSEIAEKRYTTLASVFREAIKWKLLAQSVKNNGGRILVEKKDGKRVEIML